jgi:hypothetical protein
MERLPAGDATSYGGPIDDAVFSPRRVVAAASTERRPEATRTPDRHASCLQVATTELVLAFWQYQSRAEESTKKSPSLPLVG